MPAENSTVQMVAMKSRVIRAAEDRTKVTPTMLMALKYLPSLRTRKTRKSRMALSTAR